MAAIIHTLSGAALSFYLDPISGRRRRAYLRDAAVRTWHDARHIFTRAARDVEHRARGIIAARRTSTTPADVTLVERVRAELGRCVSHPHTIAVSAADGRVTLRGDVLLSERSRLIEALAMVRGVREVTDELATHASKAGISRLQGARAVSGRRHVPADVLSAVGLLAATVGAAVLTRRSVPATIVLGFTAASVGRAILHEPMHARRSEEIDIEIVSEEGSAVASLRPSPSRQTPPPLPGQRRETP